MSETQKKAYLVAAAMAILHNGKRYEQGDKIELTEEEAENLSLYVKLAETAGEQRKQAEQTAEVEQVVAENTTTEATVTDAEQKVAPAQEQETKSRKGKKQ
ncbi:TPA: hypothetical protein ACY370_001737 [Pasteurella multocida]